jgi:hypothetical protein
MLADSSASRSTLEIMQNEEKFWQVLHALAKVSLSML